MEFIKQFKRVVNTGQSRSIVLSGNIYDLFESKKTDGTTEWVPLIYYLANECTVAPNENTRGFTHIVWRLNNPIEVRGDMDELQTAWSAIFNTKLQDRIDQSNTNTVYALELLRQLTELSRRYTKRRHNLLIIIEAADVRIPECELSRMSLADRHAVAIVNDWFSDPRFMEGGDTVVLLSESRSNIHHRIARLPQVVSVEVPLPDLDMRERYIIQKSLMKPEEATVTQFQSGLTPRNIAEQSSGLSIHALRQLMLSEDYTSGAIAKKVEEYMTGQLGDGVVEFKRPTQTLKDVIGFSRLKEFMAKELIPAFKAGTISGAAVGGPIGGGKTFLCEAVAAELGIPVVTLKNIRSKWYGETDEIFERLRRLLESFHRIVIFVDEADTQFGGVGAEEQATERRLTGKIQAMMSDVALKGKVCWFLMTARIHLLSPDIRRPGRMDLIIPILDPSGEDRKAFIEWAMPGLTGLAGLGGTQTTKERLTEVDMATKDWSAAAFAMLRSQTKTCKTLEQVFAILKELLPPDIGHTRRYQTLQALLNCTRRSLIPAEHLNPGESVEVARGRWQQEIQKLESLGVR